MRGFEFADTPDRPVTGMDTLRLGGRTLIIIHPGAAHTRWRSHGVAPQERVLFAGDLLVEDGVTMVVDGNSGELLRALAAIDSLRPRGRARPRRHSAGARPALVARTRTYITGLRAEMRSAVEQGQSRWGARSGSLPPADQTRPVSLNSRRRRNAVRVYLEEERAYMGLDSVP